MKVMMASETVDETPSDGTEIWLPSSPTHLLTHAKRRSLAYDNVPNATTCCAPGMHFAVGSGCSRNMIAGSQAADDLLGHYRSRPYTPGTRGQQAGDAGGGARMTSSRWRVQNYHCQYTQYEIAT